MAWSASAFAELSQVRPLATVRFANRVSRTVVPLDFLLARL